MTASRTTIEAALLLARNAPATVVSIRTHRDPFTRAHTHVARLTDDTWRCDCGCEWSAQAGSGHPWRS